MSKRGRGEKCTYCKRTLESVTAKSMLAATRDHVLPKSMGGQRTVWACRQCNNVKGNLSPELWAIFMQRNPEWWKQTRFRYGIRLRDRWECLGLPPLAARTAVAGVTRDDHAGNLVPDTRQPAGAASDGFASS